MSLKHGGHRSSPVSGQVYVNRFGTWHGVASDMAWEGEGPGLSFHRCKRSLRCGKLLLQGVCATPPSSADGSATGVDESSSSHCRCTLLGSMQFFRRGSVFAFKRALFPEVRQPLSCKRGKPANPKAERSRSWALRLPIDSST
eukprot:Skav228642  [mRNA]  locus=scaffold5539:16486:29449:+ [translate_table: standard]